MTNQEIGSLFRNIAASYTIKDENKHRFQIIAYQKAADTIAHSPVEMRDLYLQKKLEELPGIGSSIRSSIEELVQTGRVRHFDTLLKSIPQAVFPLLDIPTFGPKKSYKLVTHFKLKDPKTVIKDLQERAEKGEIGTIEGFGEKSEQDILRAIREFQQGKGKVSRMVLPYANALAEKIIEHLLKCKDVIGAYTLGSLRRMVATVGDIDIAVASSNPQAVIKHFLTYPSKDRVIEQGTTTASLLVSGGRQVDLMIQPQESFGSLLQHFTGSKNHNVHLREYALKKGLSLSEYGIKKMGKITKYDSEEKFYQALGMVWIPPELREDTGEIEAAVQHKLPKLIEVKDIKGDFHLHSNFPIEPSHDLGTNSMEELINKAIILGYSYIGFSEHNPSQSNHTEKQMYSILLKRKEHIDYLQKGNKSIRILQLLETDILPSGNLSINNSCLDLLDGTIVSIHSVFSMEKAKMTKRVLKGLSHPKAKILAHPTGRLLNQRQGYDLNWDEVFSFCKKYNKAIEINASPLRLDLPDSLVREAVRQGIKMIINTDSHASSQMDLMKYGVAVARRGWATKSDIINTLEYNKLTKWFTE